MRVLLATATAVLLLGGLTACTDDDPKPQHDASSDPPVPTSSTPTSAPPTSETPPAGETAEEFLRRWQEEAYEMQVSGDTTSYRSMTRNCESCDTFASAIDSIYAEGGSVTTQPTTVNHLHRVGTTHGIQVFEYALISKPTAVRDDTGKVTQRLPGGRANYQVNVVPTESSWLVARISELI